MNHITPVENKLPECLHHVMNRARRGGTLFLIRSMRSEPLMRFGAGFGLNRYSSASNALRRVKTKLQKDRKFKARLDCIESNTVKGQTKTLISFSNCTVCFAYVVRDDSCQTIMHAHIHLIPRQYSGTPNPRDRVRCVIPGKMAY